MKSLDRKQVQWLFIAVAGLAILAVAIVSTFTGVSPVLGQEHLSCDDPFAEERPSFNLSFWTETDFCQRSVSFSELRSGGPPPDGIPPIDDPQFESIESARTWMADQSPVISLEINDDARAYPLAVMTWHEIANDVVGGEPVAVTFCPLCNSSIVFDRVMELNGEEVTLRMGVSGLLRNSDLVMWDDVTQSWWQQFTGEGIVGEFNDSTLEIVPSQVVSLDAFAEQHPDGVVLSRDTGFGRDYGRNPYGRFNYDTNPGRPFLFGGDIDDRLTPPTARVLGGIVGGEPIAYPFLVLSEEIVVNDTVGGVPVVAFWQPGKVSALDQDIIDESRDVGMAALYSRELDGEELTFSVVDGQLVDDQTGSIWNVFGTATGGELEGSQLQQIVAAPHFWFAWAAFQPETAIYGLDQS